jgi:hypothetical protein
MGSIFFLWMIVAFVSAQTWSGKTIKDGDVTIIKNPKEPMYKGDILTLKEDLRLGGSKAKGDYIFNGILTLAVDDEGNIYILDEKGCLIKVFDKSGKYLRTIGRKGQGPGEINFPYALDLNSATREIVVLDAASRRFSFFDFQGRFIRSQSLKSVSGLKMRLDSRGNIILLSAVLGGNNPHYELKICHPDMTPLLALAESPAPVSANRVVNPFRPKPVFEVVRNDNVIFAVPSDYDLKISSVQLRKLKSHP